MVGNIVLYDSHTGGALRPGRFAGTGGARLDLYGERWSAELFGFYMGRTLTTHTRLSYPGLGRPSSRDSLAECAADIVLLPLPQPRSPS